MAEYHYRFIGETKWQSQSGTAIWAIVNKTGSGKKININNFQIYTHTFFGAESAADTLTSTPTLFCIVPVTALSGGTTWTGGKLDTNASDWPNTVLVKTGTTYTPQWEDVSGSLTDGTVAIGDTTFTPGVSPAWTTDQHRYNGSILNVSSGNNIGQYQIVSNTATAATIDPPLYQAGSTTGTIQRMKRYASVGQLKNFTTGSLITPVSLGVGSVGTVGRSGFSGLIWTGTSNSSLERILVKQNESIALVAKPIHANLPLFLQVSLTVEGTPNRTFIFTKLINVLSENEAIFSIENQNGSGQTIRIDQINVGEVGTFDTPYFQLVPLGPIDPVAYSDPDKKITAQATPTNPSSPALSTTVTELFTNAPALPPGVIPQSYLAEGSAGSPRGFNYLNTKDFIGPVYMTLFPELTPMKAMGWLGNSAAGAITAWNSRSTKYSALRGRTQPIVIRSGEQLGLVSGAESATAATAVPMSGWHTFYIGVDFSVEDATTITVTVVDSAGSPVQSARVYIEKVSDDSQVLNDTTNVSGVVTTTFDFQGSDVPVRIRVRKSSSAPKYVPYETLGTITSAGLTTTCVVTLDTITT